MITCRRHYLDEVMKGLLGEFDGVVLDIGGKRHNVRGSFRPPFENVERWAYLNMDADTEPDYLGDATDIPMEDSAADWFVLTEVLEHVVDPYAVLAEANRILKPGGRGIITMPFLNQVHADPDDYRRWTWYKFNDVLEGHGFEVVRHGPMGGVVAVNYDLIRAHFYRSHIPGRFFGRVVLKLINILGPMALWLDRRSSSSHDYITTGWFAVVQKSETNPA